MINLLPPKEKEKLLLEKKTKITIIFWLLILFFIICLILFLFLAKIYLGRELRLEEALLSKTRRNHQQENLQKIRQRVKVSNSNFKKLNAFYKNKIYFSDVLEDISKIFPDDFFLTQLSINSLLDKKKRPSTEISLSGFCPTREKLFAFREVLKKSDNFRDIYFSPSNWVKAADINFFIKFKLK